jgi:xylulokinase
VSLLGIDVGTTGCKAAVFSEEGFCLAEAYREYPILRPRNGWAELDSRKVWDSVKKLIVAVAAGARKDPVTALSFSSIGEALVPVDREGGIIANSILMSDQRGGEYISALQSKISQESFYEINPNILGPHYSLPKLLWIKENQPDLYDRTYKFLLWGDFLTLALGCEPLTSYSLANRTLLFDIRKERWSEILLELSGVSPEKLPLPVPSGTVAGTVNRAVSTLLGLPPNVKVVVGGHDQACNSLGAGSHRPGRAICGIGTVECITPTYESIPEAQVMLANGLNVEHHVVAGRYVSFVYNQAGALVRWFRDTFAAADKASSENPQRMYELLTAEMPHPPTRLLVLPYFEITGPPRFVADGAGVIAGLKTSTKRGEILKAILESETFYFVESLDVLRSLGIDTSEFIATGGGARSDQWLQIKADILGIPFVRLQSTECSVAGAAILAGLGTGVYSNPDEAVARYIKIDKRFEPDPVRNRIYRSRYSLYKGLLERVQDMLPGISSAEEKGGV